MDREQIELRELAHKGVFRSVYARNCTVRRIDAATACDFLAKYHLIGPLKGRYRYGLFVEKPGRSGLPLLFSEDHKASGLRAEQS